MSDYNAEVIQYLKRKENGDYTVPLVWLGFEPCFIEAIRGSSLNNLEEQLVFGTDICSEEYLDEEQNRIIETHYCQTDNVAEVPNHYKIKTTIYKEPETEGDEFVFRGNKLVISESVGVAFGDGSSEYPNENKIYLLNSNYFQIDDENNSLKSYPNVNYITQKDELIYIQSDMKELIVAIKYSLEKYTKDGKKIIYTYIDNKKLKGE